jgi:hypothetical protein
VTKTKNMFLVDQMIMMKHFIELKIIPLYMSGEDLYFVKWPVVSVKLVIIDSS